jgi:hypothetical protein
MSTRSTPCPLCNSGDCKGVGDSVSSFISTAYLMPNVSIMHNVSNEGMVSRPCIHAGLRAMGSNTNEGGYPAVGAARSRGQLTAFFRKKIGPNEKGNVGKNICGEYEQHQEIDYCERGILANDLSFLVGSAALRWERICGVGEETEA